MSRGEQFPLPWKIPGGGAPGDTGYKCGLIHGWRGAGRNELACCSNQGVEGAALLTGAPDVLIVS
jgi:hypothetical protein